MIHDAFWLLLQAREEVPKIESHQIKHERRLGICTHPPWQLNFNLRHLLCIFFRAPLAQQVNDNKRLHCGC